VTCVVPDPSWSKEVPPSSPPSEIYYGELCTFAGTEDVLCPDGRYRKAWKYAGKYTTFLASIVVWEVLDDGVFYIFRIREVIPCRFFAASWWFNVEVDGEVSKIYKENWHLEDLPVEIARVPKSSVKEYCCCYHCREYKDYSYEFIII